MMRSRPFASRETLMASALGAAHSLSREDWLEAFSHHPMIGDRASLAKRFPATAHLSEREQAGVDAAVDDVVSALADANDAYRNRFGHIFIVCATGLTAGEILERLRARLHNDPDTELQVAAREQEKITALRLDGI